MRLLDLFCGAGGAAMGYYRAGFDDITGVDIRPMPRYPFEFIQGDALEYLAAHGHEYDAIHASPPCQGYSRLQHAPNRSMDSYPQLVSEVRELLKLTGKPYAIENVPGAPLENAVLLCGTMFGLRVIRHRLFESVPVIYFAPASCHHWGRVKPKKHGNKLGYYCNGNTDFVTVAGHLFSRTAGSKAMGIDWMTIDELAESIPPAYTEYIGRQLLAALEVTHD